MSHTAKKSSRSSSEDRISALPEGVLQHVLGFLPAGEAVQTSLIARRWRYLWRSVRRLRVTYVSRHEESTRGDFFVKFVNCLLLLRDPGSPLDEVEFDCDVFEADSTCINMWIRHALLCQAQVLTINFTVEGYLYLDGTPLVSRHLRRLELFRLDISGNILNFSSCPALEDLTIINCFFFLTVSRILSQSLKRLSIKGCVFSHDFRIRISVPNLVSLQLVSFSGRTPLLESMPSLETAVVRPQNYFYYYCRKYDSGECCGTCANCCGNDDHNGACVLLGGLKSATNLELIAFSGMFIFRRDLRWCPTFGKLKSLLLNEWCVHGDLRELVSMLKHSPVLESLTFILRKEEKPKLTLEMEENYGWTEKSAAISRYLKIVKVICEEVDGRVCKILKFLSKFDIEVTVKRDKALFGW